MLNYQFQWQINGYYCAPAATRIAMTARGLYPSQSDLAGQLGTTVSGTNSANDTTRVLNGAGHTAFYKSRFILGNSATQAEIDRLKADVLNAVGKGFPIVANIAGDATDTEGHAHSYPGGHYLTVVGYTDGGQTVKIADPADAYGRGSYLMPTQRLAHWIALRGYSA
jgi:Peptidase_C39 like family